MNSLIKQVDFSSDATTNDKLRRIRKFALDSLARREHSTAELQRKLLNKFNEYDLVDIALTKLLDEKLLSDERFTEAYVNHRSKSGFGPSRILAELRERGVKDSIATLYINDNGINWRQLARDIHVKKFGHISATVDEKAKQIRFLEYRGFNHDHINNIF